jgi:hypothetical protein
MRALRAPDPALPESHHAPVRRGVPHFHTRSTPPHFHTWKMSVVAEVAPHFEPPIPRSPSPMNPFLVDRMALSADR